jgi:predicted DNA-binding transcriptional regulator AlpA
MDKLLTTEQIAELTGMSKSWFEHQRWLGGDEGPRYVKIGRSVRYRLVDVQEWLERARQKATAA